MILHINYLESLIIWSMSLTGWISALSTVMVVGPPLGAFLLPPSSGSATSRSRVAEVGRLRSPVSWLDSSRGEGSGAAAPTPLLADSDKFMGLACTASSWNPCTRSLTSLISLLAPARSSLLPLPWGSGGRGMSETDTLLWAWLVPGDSLLGGRWGWESVGGLSTKPVVRMTLTTVADVAPMPDPDGPAVGWPIPPLPPISEAPCSKSPASPVVPLVPSPWEGPTPDTNVPWIIPIELLPGSCDPLLGSCPLPPAAPDGPGIDCCEGPGSEEVPEEKLGVEYVGVEVECVIGWDGSLLSPRLWVAGKVDTLASVAAPIKSKRKNQAHL